MNEKFFELKKEKQDRIINGILKIFAEKQYADAATENIIKAAGISKGLLFHYFDTKLGAYTFAYNYTVRYLILELGGSPWGDDPSPKDVFLSMQSRVCTVLRNYPYLQLFLEKVHSENVEEAAPLIKSVRTQLEDILSHARLYAEFSFSKVGEDYFYDIPEEMFWESVEYLSIGRQRKILSSVDLQQGFSFDAEGYMRWLRTALERFH